jgi:hypothetical protein
MILVDKLRKTDTYHDCRSPKELGKPGRADWRERGVVGGALSITNKREEVTK